MKKKKTEYLYFQQGDVVPKPLPIGDFDELPEEKIPADAEPIPGGTLALGEATGHAHRLLPTIDPRAYQLFESPKTKRRYLRLLRDVPLRHEEHKEIKLPAGDYRIDHVLEEDPFEKRSRQVAD